MKTKFSAFQSALVCVSLAVTSMTSNAGVSEYDIENLTPTFKSISTSTIKTRRIIVEYRDQFSTAQASINSINSNSLTTDASQAAGVGIKHIRKMGTGAHVFKFKQKMNTKKFNKAMLKLASNPNV